MSMPYLTEPPTAKWLDRGVRASAYASMALFALSVLGDDHPFTQSHHWDQWYTNVLLYAMLLSAVLGTFACLSGRSQAEMVLLPVLLGSLASVIILASGSSGFVLPHVAILGTAFLLFAVRLNWLHWTARKARVIHLLNAQE